VTWSRDREFRLIRPLVFVREELTRSFAESVGAPLIPCGCSQKTGTVRETLRDMFSRLEKDFPHLKETMLAALANVELGRLLDTRFLDLEDFERES
jgi:tRNA 2-thiocytidine biosynthesis protein TtcA